MPTRQPKPTVGSAPSSTFLDPLPGIIPFGSLVLLVGPPKCGKTALLASWLARWRDGKTICGQPTNRPTGLGIITTDHKWALNQGVWFAAAGFPDIPHVSLRDDPNIKWATLRGRGNGATQMLEQSLETLALPPGALVVLDVAGVFISNHLNDYNDVLAGMGILSQTLDRYQYTGIGVGHMGKQRADPKERYLRPHERILGSGAQIGFSDTTMYLLGPQDTGQPYHTFGWLPTHAPEGEFHLHQNSHTGLFEPYTGSLEPDPEVPAAYLLVLDRFPLSATVGLSAAEALEAIMQTCAVAERQAWRVLETLLLKGLVQKTPARRYARVQKPLDSVTVTPPKSPVH